ncbi:hypothetical protein DIPPA_02603 [Diplonema papillatum]|nr:hypothetical protein DIPPA_02603 [Diplonema papillatum]
MSAYPSGRAGGVDQLYSGPKILVPDQYASQHSSPYSSPASDKFSYPPIPRLPPPVTTIPPSQQQRKPPFGFPSSSTPPPPAPHRHASIAGPTPIHEPASTHSPTGDGLRHKNATLESDLAQMQNAYEQTQHMYEEQQSVLQQTLQDLSRLLEAEKAKNRQLEEQSALVTHNSDGHRHALQQHVVAMHDQFEQYKQQQAQRMQDLMQQQQAEFAAEKERLNEHYRVTANELQNREEDTRQKLTAYQEHMERLVGDKDKQLETLLGEKEALKTVIEQGAQECRQMVDDIGDLKTELQAAEKANVDLREAHENEWVTARLDREKQEETMRVLLNEIKGLNESLESVRTDSADKDAVLAKHLATLQQQKMENEQLKAEITLQLAELQETHDTAARKAEILADIGSLSRVLRATALDYADMKFNLELGKTELPPAVDEKRNPPSKDKQDADSDAPADEDADGEAREEGEGEEDEEGTAPAVEALLATPEHLITVELTGSKDLLRDVIDGLRDAVAKLQAENQALIDGHFEEIAPEDNATTLTDLQLTTISSAAASVYSGVCREKFNLPRLETGRKRDARAAPQDDSDSEDKNKLPTVFYEPSTAQAVIKRLKLEWENKPGDVLDELMELLEPADGASVFGILTETARTVRGTVLALQEGLSVNPVPVSSRLATTGYPGLNLMDFLLLRVYTMTGPDLDTLLLHTGAPSYASTRAWEQYIAREGEVGGLQNKSIYEEVEDALHRLSTSDPDDEKAWTEVRPYLKTIGLLTALAATQHTADAASGVTVCHEVSALPVVSEGDEIVLAGPLSCSLDRHIVSDVQSVFITNVRQGRHLEAISAFPREKALLLPLGAKLVYKSRTVDGHMFEYQSNLRSQELTDWLNQCRADSETAAARLEQGLLQRSLTDALDAANDRMRGMQMRCQNELEILQSRADELQQEVDSLADTVVKAQDLSASAFKERDAAVIKNTDLERRLAQQELAEVSGLRTTKDTSDIAAPEPIENSLQRPACEDCMQRKAEVSCTLCRARLCSACSDRIHAGGIMMSHPVRLLDAAKRKRRVINTAHMDPSVGAEIRKLEGKYEKMKDRCKALQVDWAKIGEATRLCQQVEREKAVLQEYIKKLEAENDGLRRLSSADAVRQHPPTTAARRNQTSAPTALPSHVNPRPPWHFTSTIMP